MLAKAIFKVLPRTLGPTVIGLAAVGVAAALPRAANATTATFSWVSTSFVTAQTPPTTPTGTLTLTLPDSITTQTFDTGVLVGGSNAAFDMITAFSYTFSDGLTATLSSLNRAASSISPAKWYTSVSFDPDGAGTAPTGIYLISGFTLTSVTGAFAGGTAQFANSAGTQGPPSSVGAEANTITPTFPPWSSNDAGYWRLTSFSAPTVPLPAALPLLISGLGALGGMVARRRRVSAA
jgi:hypothetical protein